nr:hypothetical protein [Tanacetum cinerariifolium]
MEVDSVCLCSKKTRAPRRICKGRNADWFDDVDADGFSVIKVSGLLKELGYDNPYIKIHYKKPTSDLDKGLEPLNTSVIDLHHEDNSVSDGLESGSASLETHKSEVLESGNVGLGTQESKDIENDNVEELDPLFSYPNTNHQMRQSRQSSEPITSPHGNVQGSDDNEESDDTKESTGSKDIDFECDIEDRIDDAHVDMEMFRKNTAPSVELVGSTEPEPEVENND